MATKLEKDVTRESSVKAGDRELLVTMTADQKITLKPKGLGNDKTLEITIDELYDNLNGSALGNNKNSQRYPDDLLIPVHELRTYVVTGAGLTYEDMVKFSGIVKDVINDTIKRIKEKEKN
jgi:hypothetical protein